MLFTVLLNFDPSKLNLIKSSRFGGTENVLDEKIYVSH